MSGGKSERFRREDVSRPGARRTRPKRGIKTKLPISRNLRLDEFRIRRGLRRIVSTAHVDLYVPKAAFGEMLFQKLQRTRSRHVRHEAHVDLGGGAMRQNGLAAGTGVSPDQTLDVDGGLGFEQHERVQPVCVMHPMLNSKLLFHGGFIAVSGGLFNHLHLRQGKRLGFVKEAGNRRRVSVGLDQRVKRLHQVPRGTIYLRFEAGMNVVFGTSSPALTARNQLEFDYPFGAQRYLYVSVHGLASFGHEHPGAFFQRCADFGLADNLRKMGRSNFFFAFADEDEVYRQLLSRRLEGMKSAQKGCF